jgi:UDP-GlcNAc:undecaprenyl-phosphate/decaprenyl-phosphate GlcNAc-1-phosphate transferase
MPHPVLVFIVSAVVGVVSGGVVRRIAEARGAVVPPRQDRWHRQSTPTFGGLAIAAGTIAGFAAARTYSWDMAIVLGVAFVMLGVGWIDDRFRLSPLAKLVSSLVAAGFVLFGLTLLRGLPPSPIVTVFAVVWFAGLVHAMNLLDNMDGLAAGIGLLAAAGFVIVFGDRLGPAATGVLCALAGSLAGFLVWNRHPARLFMGDCGSLFIGSVLGGCSLLALLGTPNPIVDSMAVMLVFSAPLFDTGFVLVLRRLAGRPATRGGTDHVSHRLVSLGLSEPRAVVSLYALGVFGVGCAWLIRTSGIPMIPAAAIFAVMVLLVGIYLARVPAYNGEDFLALQKTSFAPLLSDLTFRWHAAEVMLDIALISFCYYASYRIRFEGEQLATFIPSFAASLPFVLGCKLASLYVSGLYSRMWSTFGLRDLSAVARGVGLGSLLSVLGVTYVYRFERFSRAVFIMDAVLLTLAIVATRASFRIMSVAATTRDARSRRVLIYGAGAGGQLIAREMMSNGGWGMRPVAFLDDDQMKIRRWFLGIPVRGNIDDLEAVLGRYQVEEVLLSSPLINGTREQLVRRVCSAHQIPVRRLILEIK